MVDLLLLLPQAPTISVIYSNTVLPYTQIEDSLELPLAYQHGFRSGFFSWTAHPTST